MQPRSGAGAIFTPDVRKTQLFLDEAIVEQTVRLKRVIHQPQKHYANPIYTVGAPWEGTGVVYLGGVYVDPRDSQWKAWYATLNPPAYPGIVYAVCLISSADGIHWKRPELDVYRGRNGERTNIVLDLGEAGGTGAPTILYEPEDQAEPWTMVLSTCVHGSWDYKGYILKSSDGVHWRWLRSRPDGVAHGMGDRCTAMRGPDPEFPYVLFSRGVEDMGKWGLVRSVHRVAINAERAQSAPARVVLPDLEDEPWSQIYHAHAFACGDSYVGLFQWYQETQDPYGEMELMTSRDTVSWQRPRPRGIFLPRSPGGRALGAFDNQITDTALSPPVSTRQGALETLWFYYWGGQAMHGNRHLSYGRGIGLAQLRGDGYCSLRAERFPATLVTRALQWHEGELSVNAAVLGGGGSGSLRVEVLTEELKPIAGLTREDADPLTFDGVRVSSWGKDPGRIRALAGRRIRLKFYLENFDLYSFRCQKEIR